MEYVENYFIELIYLVNEMSPYLLLGFVFAGLLHILLPKYKVNKYVGKNNFKSVLYATLLGIPLPLCSCGVIPTGISYYKNGASKGSTISFLISTPQTGVDSILVSYSMLGLPFAILRPIIAFFTGIFGGMLTNKFVEKDPPVNTNEEEQKNAGETKNLLTKMLKYAFVDFLQDLSKWLIIGLLIAALIGVLVPDDFFSSYISNEYLSMLLILAASVPLYVCATGSVPIAAGLLLKGLSPGAAIVFLMAGPATNAATLTVISKSMGKKSLFLYLGSIIFGALFFGTLVNELIPRGWLLSHINLIGSHEHHEHGLGLWIKYASSILLVGLIVNGYIQKYRQKRKAISETIITNNMVKKFKVQGMNCNHCVNNVQTNLMKIEGIKDVKANFQTEEVIIDGDGIDPEIIKSTVEGLGYKFGGQK